MPQLDLFSWMHNVFTLFVILSLFYLGLSLFFLPGLSSISKGRHKLINFRKTLSDFLKNQTALLTKEVHTNLAFFFFNNQFLINAYYQPVFEVKLQKYLMSACYNVTINELQHLFANKLMISFIKSENLMKD
jgi:hypothetical protein